MPTCADYGGRVISIIAGRFEVIADTHWLEPYRKNTGMVVPVDNHDFSEWMRKLHKAADVPSLHNGLRRSAISYYLAAHPETGIGQLARWCGSSEATIKRHYLEVLLPEVGLQWFAQTLIISREKRDKAMLKAIGRKSRGEPTVAGLARCGILIAPASMLFEISRRVLGPDRG